VSAASESSVASAVSRLQQLYEIDVAAGANRPGLSLAEQRAHDLVATWMTDAGLEVSVDRAGNLIGRLAGRDQDLAEAWTGSHLDTVPDGGRYDGALGVVAGLQAVARIARGGPRRRTIAVVAFRDEEGWRFGEGFFGSRALCGQLGLHELDLRDAGGTSIREALRQLGLVGAIAERGRLPGAFVELHLEQGNELAERGRAVGVVDAIVAMSGMGVSFTGARAHAGGAAMAHRRDALVAAAHFIVATTSRAASRADWRATVGDVRIAAAASNVVPSHVSVTVDLRARSDEALEDLSGELCRLATEAGEAARCESDARVVWTRGAIAMDGSLSEILADALTTAPGSAVRVTSWAGHDAGVLGSAGVPVGMLFMRAGAGGVSHSPDESVSEADIGAGVSVLEQVLGRLGDSGDP
jgi:allantoate deiminase